MFITEFETIMLQVMVNYRYSSFTFSYDLWSKKKNNSTQLTYGQ